MGMRGGSEPNAGTARHGAMAVASGTRRSENQSAMSRRAKEKSERSSASAAPKGVRRRNE